MDVYQYIDKLIEIYCILKMPSFTRHPLMHRVCQLSPKMREMYSKLYEITLRFTV